MISIFIAPELPHPQPQPIIASASTTADILDCKLIELVGHDQPVALWRVIHEIIESEQPANRTERRQLCSRLLCRLRGLIQARKIMRESKSHVRVAAPPAAITVPSKQVKNLPPLPYPSVDDLSSFHGGGSRKIVFKV